MEDVSTNLWYYYYSAKIKKYLTRNSPISFHTVVLRLFRSKTRGRTTRDENETKLRANSRFQSLSFPRRFPIIRYLTRVPLSRSYVIQQRVSVRVFPKRFMNYVDGWVRGRGVCAYRGDPNASGLFWQNVVYRCGIWWIGICMEKKGLTFFVPFYRIIGTIIVADTSRIFRAVHIRICASPRDLHRGWSKAVTIEMENAISIFYANLFGNIRSTRQLSVTCSKY